MRWKRALPLAAWTGAALPALAGTAVKLLAILEQIRNPMLYLRGDLGTIALLLGGLMSAWLASSLWLWRRAENIGRTARAETRKKAARDRRRFLQRLDHELKNPLTAIRAGLANLGWDSSDAEQKAVIESVEAQTLRLSRLAADLRKLADLETRPLERSQVDLTAMLQEVADVARELPGADARHISLAVPQAPWPLPTIDGDADLLFLAIHNLVSNAIKFTAPEDTVEIRAFEDGSLVVIEVADTGSGIPPEEIPHVWEELYRGQRARGIPGSGLGLALVRAIIDRHQGTTSLRSRLDQGTVFTVRLPHQRD